MRVPMSPSIWKLAVPLTAAAVAGAAVVGVRGDAVHATRQEAAAASCTLNVPATISVDAPAKTPAVSVGSDCAAAGVVLAKWDSHRATDGGLDHQFISRWNKPDVQWNVFDAGALGPRTWNPAGATTGTDPALASANSTAATVPQNAPTTDIRLRATGQLASWSFVAGCKTTFNAVATRYAPTWDGYVAYAGATGSLWFQPLDHSWTSRLADFTFDAAGKASATVNTNGVTGEYRVWVNDVYALTWAASSAWKPIANPSC